MSKNQGPSRSASEWFKLITECRQSGLSDTAWCLQNGVPRSTTSPLDFTSKQDVVEISISQDSVPVKYSETVQDQSNMNVSRNALYLFCGRKRDRIKAILQEPDGIVLMYKRLTVDGSFKWPRNKSEVRQANFNAR